MIPLKIKRIVKKKEKEEVYDIHHKLDSKQFLDNHPNLIANEKIISNCGRHAAGVLVSTNISKHMPLINSGGVVQSPWSEGQNVRQLEPMGFIKFDLLGLATLRMFEGAIRLILRRRLKIKEPTFDDVKKFYNENLHPDVIDLADRKVFKNVFHKGKWAGIFQCSTPGAQAFYENVKPNTLEEICAVSSIYRPSTLAANVDKEYIEARKNPQFVQYEHPIIKEVLGDTFSLIIYQEQIALLAHKLGKDISLEEGNKLRKLLTKKGIGSTEEEKNKIYIKFVDGCEEKGINRIKADEFWKKMEYFSGYGFNFSHGLSYSIISFQCAWLLTYYEPEWLCAFLDNEPEAKKEKAIGIAKSLGYKIEPLNINKSGRVWEVDKRSSKTLIQPLTSIKGLGETAIDQVLANRPFKSIEDVIFNENVVGSKLNKRALDAMLKSEALEDLMDERFDHMRHFWLACLKTKPSSPKKLAQMIEEYRGEPDYTEEEKIEHLVSLSGVFPLRRVMDDSLLKSLHDKCIPSISDYDKDLQVVWFIPRECILRKTKKGKDYYVLSVIDGNSVMTQIRCWGIKKDKDRIFINRPYMGKLNHNDQWGFSSYGMLNRSFKLLA